MTQKLGNRVVEGRRLVGRQEPPAAHRVIQMGRDAQRVELIDKLPPLVRMGAPIS